MNINSMIYVINVSSGEKGRYVMCVKYIFKSASAKTVQSTFELAMASHSGPYG